MKGKRLLKCAGFGAAQGQAAANCSTTPRPPQCNPKAARFHRCNLQAQACVVTPSPFKPDLFHMRLCWRWMVEMGGGLLRFDRQQQHNGAGSIHRGGGGGSMRAMMKNVGSLLLLFASLSKGGAKHTQTLGTKAKSRTQSLRTMMVVSCGSNELEKMIVLGPRYPLLCNSQFVCLFHPSATVAAR